MQSQAESIIASDIQKSSFRSPRLLFGHRGTRIEIFFTRISCPRVPVSVIDRCHDALGNSSGRVVAYKPVSDASVQLLCRLCGRLRRRPSFDRIQVASVEREMANMFNYWSVCRIRREECLVILFTISVAGLPGYKTFTQTRAGTATA